MAKKNKDLGKKIYFWNEMRDETVRTILALFSFLLMILSLLAAFGKAGWGNYAYEFLLRLFGVGYYLVPIALAMLGISFLQGIKKKMGVSKIIGVILFFLSGLGLIHIAYTEAGGVIGRWIASPLLRIIDFWPTIALLIMIFATSILMTFELHLSLENLLFWRYFDKRWSLEDGMWVKKAMEGGKEGGKLDSGKIDAYEEQMIDNAVASVGGPISNLEREEIARVAAEQKRRDGEKARAGAKKGGDSIFSDDGGASFLSAVTVPYLKDFTPPPLSLLEKDKGKPETGDIKANANIIKRTLQNFNITVEMDEISIGPSVTRYALKPAEGVKLSRIVTLNNDLSLALAAHPIRIEAPIPGKSLVGIEVPNTAKTTVGLATLLGTSDFQESEKPLLMSLGKDIAGKAHFANLAKAPHALIAGATGSGKSVTIHALITSLLYRNSPENLKFIMIDPKRVELTMYNKIPHLL
ncbi:MAG: cell division protein ftsK, segregation ATPase FtsK/SpoIIIE, family, partial [Candidatus Parcubacteria bacterium]